jgi:hypothetical protein
MGRTTRRLEPNLDRAAVMEDWHTFGNQLGLTPVQPEAGFTENVVQTTVAIGD